MEKPVVGLVRFNEKGSSLSDAIEYADGFAGLDKNAPVLIKVNQAWGSLSKKFPLFGFATTARIVEDLVILLKEFGCSDIAIGEGTIPNAEFGSTTAKAFRSAGYTDVARRYGVRLIDFNEGPHRKVSFGGFSAHIAEAVFSAGFLINLPVLKTHAQTKISLVMKNLKGCLDFPSKMAFHRNGLEEPIARLAALIRPNLTIIDGIYAMANGPDFATGQSSRADVIIAGKDQLACDMVGARILGIDPNEVDHLVAYAALENPERKISDDAVEIRGVSVQALACPLPWKRNFLGILDDAGISGLTFQEPGKQACTGCMSSVRAVLVSFAKDNPGITMDLVEICVGPEVKPLADSRTVFLAGNCSIKSNKDIPEAAYAHRIPGCPLSSRELFMALMRETLGQSRTRKILLARIAKKIATKLRLYDEDFGFMARYPQPEFNPGHFTLR
jgi:uncharacterized protein (DUF362 family)